MLKQVAEVVNGLRKGAQYLNFQQQLTTAVSCHLAKLFYCIEVWGHEVTRAQLESLQAAQNKVLRWGTDTPSGTSLVSNLKAYGLISVRQMIIFRTMYACLKIMHDEAPVNLLQFINDERSAEAAELKGFYQDRHLKYVFRNNFHKLPDDLKQLPDVRRVDF